MQRTRNGFTLIELAIVLVIIGLVTGGVLLGRDLIQSAAIRQQVSQIEQYKLAYKTFRLKYNAVPGDILASEAASFGFTPRSGARGHGDGNGIVEDCTASINSTQECEFILFWSDLSTA